MNSYWIESTKNIDSCKPINQHETADVCIIGAGLSGLSTAYYLTKNGLKVIIVDKSGIGEKASGHTTAKITYAHNLIYDYLISSFNQDFAYGYYKSNKQAIENIQKIIEEEKIDCDFEYQPNYIYTIDQNEIVKLQDEVKAYQILQRMEENTNSVQFVTESELPFQIAGAIKIENQAQFHPRKYMLGLAKAIQRNGGTIFIDSVVSDIKKDGDEYTTYANGYTIKAKYVVIASHYPFINFPGFYFSKMYQSTSYAIGIETEKSIPNGMYINTKDPIFSFRNAKEGEKRILILGGGNHKTGFAPESEINFGYQSLEEMAKKHYPDARIKYRWNTRDCISLDKVPYIGEFSMMYPNMYVATGFNKWGMTTSNVAGNIISDSILKKQNDYAGIYLSTRLEPLKNKEEVGNMVRQVFESFITNRIKIPKEELDVIQKGNGGIIKIDGKSVGIYKDSQGKIYAINPSCTHLGCLLTWNNLDKTWDCPCHGSRFDYTGKNLYDPAFKDLKKYDIE